MPDEFQIKLTAPIQDAIERADPKNVDLAVARTVREIADQATTAAFRNLGQEYNLTQKAARAQLKNPKPKARSVKRGSNHFGLVDFIGKRISLIHFKPTVHNVMSRIGRRKGVKVRIRKRDQAKFARHDAQFAGFKGRGRAGLTDGAGADLVFRRFKQPTSGSREDRHPVKKMDTKASSMMLMSSRAHEAMDSRIAEQFHTVLARNLNYYQNVRGRRR